MKLNNPPLAVFTTLADVSASRAPANDYTNTSGKPMAVTLMLEDRAATANGLASYIGPTTPSIVGPAVQYLAHVGTIQVSVSFIVPPGWHYEAVAGVGAPYTLTWLEAT